MKNFKMFHYLIENKSTNEYPFTFIWTYTTPNNGIQRPIKYALTEFQSSSNMLELLAFMDKQKRSNTLVGKLLREDIALHPCMLSLDEANQFINEIDEYKVDVDVRLPKWKKTQSLQIQPKFEKGKVGLGVMNFNVGIFIDKQEFTLEQLAEIVENNAPLALIKNKWIRLDKTQIKKTFDVIKELKEAANNVEAKSTKEALDQIQEAAKEIEVEVKISNEFWLNLLETKLGGFVNSDIDLSNLNAELRPYQVIGVQYLTGMYNLGFGGILGDDQGLGKTLQTIAFLNSLKNQGKTGRTLVIAPTSLLGNWAKEIEVFAPKLNRYILHASYNNKLHKRNIPGYNSMDIIITSYGYIARQEWLKKEDWNCIILDEAQNIKNPNAQRTKNVKELKGNFKLAISGTPLENKIDDIYSILDFCNPGLYGSLLEFKKFSNESNLPTLRKITEFFILRRVKENKDIISLPSKNIIDVQVDMSLKQIALYSNIIDRVKQKEMTVLASLVKLKQITNHPSQYLGDEGYAIEDSGKFVKLLEIAKEVKAKNKALVIFTQFTEIIPSLMNLLSSVFIQGGDYIDGSVSAKSRTQRVEAFQERKIDFLVCSIKAANAGITLTAASDLIFFDLPWAPSTMNQAMDRIHRIGQSEDCTIYRLIMEGTLEEGIVNLLQSKQELFDAVIPKHQEEVVKKEFINVFKKNLLSA